MKGSNRLHRLPRIAEDRFRLLVDSIRDYAIFMLDAEGHVATWNTGAERLKGYRAEEILGRHFSTLYPPEDVASGRPGRQLEAAAAQGRVEDEGWRVRRDGSRFWVNVVITALRDEAGQLVGFGKVTRDLTERQKAEEERIRLAREQAARAEAEAAVRARDAFLARASHELRTPLTSAVATVGLLRRAMAGSLGERPEMLIDIADRNLKAMSQLVNDLLDVAELDGAAQRLRVEPVELADVVRQSILLTRSEIRGKRLVVDCLVPDGFQVQADALELEQVLVNLVDNAVKFAPEEGKVTIGATLDDEAVSIQVRDAGPGIPAEHLERIFEPFFRSPQAGERQPRGTGLGLAICRRIVTLHGGRIWAESEGPGRGATFTVRLPRRVPGRRGP